MNSKTKGTQKPWECEHCGKTGKNRANYRRDHGSRCPNYLVAKSGRDRLLGFTVGVASISVLWGISAWVL